jgi:hypothetical protein
MSKLELLSVVALLRDLRGYGLVRLESWSAVVVLRLILALFKAHERVKSAPTHVSVALTSDFVLSVI